MRCGCPACGAFMPQSEGAVLRCICPDCGYYCTACLGTNSMLSRADIRRMKRGGMPEIGALIDASERENDEML